MMASHRQQTKLENLFLHKIIDFIFFCNNGPIFYAYRSVHRESILKKFRDDTLYSTLLFPVSRSTCFGRNPRPSSGAHLNSIHSIWDDSSTTTAGHTPSVNPDAVNTV
jgi:hypothetical protein